MTELNQKINDAESWGQHSFEKGGAVYNELLTVFLKTDGTSLAQSFKGHRKLICIFHLFNFFAKISICAMPKKDDDLEEIFRSPDKLVHDPLEE